MSIFFHLMLWTAALGLAAPAMASRITEIGPSGLQARLTDRTPHPWRVGEKACVCKDGVAETCDATIVYSQDGAVVVEFPYRETMPEPASPKARGEIFIQSTVLKPWPVSLNGLVVSTPAECAAEGATAAAEALPAECAPAGAGATLASGMPGPGEAASAQRGCAPVAGQAAPARATPEPVAEIAAATPVPTVAPPEPAPKRVVIAPPPEPTPETVAVAPPPAREIAAIPAPTPASVARVPSEPSDRAWLIAAGTDLLYPALDLEHAIGRNVALGLLPVYVRGKGGSGTLSGFGGLLTASWYPTRAFDGFWLLAGAGAQRFTATVPASGGTFLRDDVTAPAFLGAVGWRWTTSGGLSASIAGGSRFVIAAPVLKSQIGFSQVQPTVILQLGFAR